MDSGSLSPRVTQTILESPVIEANRELSVPVGNVSLRGTLDLARDGAGVLVFVHEIVK